MTDREVMQQALEALECMIDDLMYKDHKRVIDISNVAITALKAALEQQQAEPVAWSHAGAMPPEQEVMKEAAYNLAPWLSAALDDPKVCKEYKDAINAWFDAAMPAPQRPWVGLTDEEIHRT